MALAIGQATFVFAHLSEDGAPPNQSHPLGSHSSRTVRGRWHLNLHNVVPLDGVTARDADVEEDFLVVKHDEAITFLFQNCLDSALTNGAAGRWYH